MSVTSTGCINASRVLSSSPPVAIDELFDEIATTEQAVDCYRLRSSNSTEDPRFPNPLIDIHLFLDISGASVLNPALIQVPLFEGAAPYRYDLDRYIDRNIDRNIDRKTDLNAQAITDKPLICE